MAPAREYDSNVGGANATGIPTTLDNGDNGVERMKSKKINGEEMQDHMPEADT